MPGLTITEKEHWKERIGKRIEKKIEVIFGEDPNLCLTAFSEARQEHWCRLDSLTCNRNGMRLSSSRRHWTSGTVTLNSP
ncbi:MAG: hypothetical protein H6823_23965 [Planctomycetaceae bacterium]|nr:hypothetical protein [Planctomycetaceae bacterium]